MSWSLTHDCTAPPAQLYCNCEPCGLVEVFVHWGNKFGSAGRHPTLMVDALGNPDNFTSYRGFYNSRNEDASFFSSHYGEVVLGWNAKMKYHSIYPT
jgi:hypothetical protein